MAFLWTTVILGVAFVFCLWLFLFQKSLGINILSGFAIITIGMFMDFPVIVMVVLFLFVLLVSYNYYRTLTITSLALTTIGLIAVLSVPAFAVTGDLPEQPDVGLPGDVISRVAFCEEVGSIRKQPNMHLLGTDYLTFDNGKLQAFLTIGEFPINNASCFVSVLFPNMTSFISNNVMFPVEEEFFDGMYFLDFTVPNATGVYPVSAHCFFNSTQNIDQPLFLMNNMTIESGGLPDLEPFDAERELLFKGDGSCSGVNCVAEFTYVLPTGFNTPFMTDFRSIINTFTTSTRTFTYQAKNFTSGGYDDLFTITNNAPATLTQFQNPLSTTHHIANDSIVIIRVTVDDFNNQRLTIESMSISRVYNGSTVKDLRGNNEVVISKKLNEGVDIILGDEEIISVEDIVNIILLLAAAFLIAAQLWILAAFMLILWVTLFSPVIMVSVIFLMIAFLLLYKGWIERPGG